MIMFVKLLMSWALTRRSYIGRHRFSRSDQVQRTTDAALVQQVSRDA